MSISEHFYVILVQVSRFLVVHGQIILNQFKNFPVKQIQRCAFVGQLQKQMEARRHSRLYLSKRKITAEMRVGRKLNPMRERSAKSKPTPMTATATNLVKAVWMNYFGGTSSENQGVPSLPCNSVTCSRPSTTWNQPVRKQWSQHCYKTFVKPFDGPCCTHT